MNKLIRRELFCIYYFFMTTILQRIRNRRVVKRRKSSKPALTRCPQKQGVVLKVFTKTPKKPNSAIRKVIRVALTNNYRVTAYVPGEMHTIQKHALVAIRGGNVADLPGVKYKVIRGLLDVTPVALRGTKRSKYGRKKRRQGV